MEYGSTTAYGSSTALHTARTAHAEVLNNLTANTTYQFRVKSRNAAGTLVTSGNYSFKTTSALDIITGLVAAYAFDEGAGVTTADFSGNARTGAINNAAWSADAKYGKALAFNLSGGPATGYLSAPPAGLPATNGQQTISVWLSLNSRSSATQSVVSMMDTVQGVSLQLGFKDSRAGVWQSGGGWLVVGNQLPSKTWNHYAYTFDGQTHRFYFNGAEVGNSTIVPRGANTNLLEIGRNGGGTEYFKGTLDEVRIYNRALTQAEIQALMTISVTSMAR